jgi:hypothetical protein
MGSGEGRRGLLAACLGDDVLRHDLGVLHRVSGHLALGDVGDVADRVDVVVPVDVESLGDVDLSRWRAVGEPAVGEVVAVDAHAVGAEPDVGGDRLASGGGDGEGLGAAGLDLGLRQDGAQPEVHAEFV